MKKKLLILGGNGYIGKHLQRFLIQKNYSDLDVIVVDRNMVEGSVFPNLLCDLLVDNQLEKIILLERPSYVINLAGVISSDNIDTLFNVNVLLPIKLLSFFSEHVELKLKKILMIGSASEYGANQSLSLREDSDLSPINNYGFSKVLQSEAVKYYYTTKQVPVCVARTFNIIGDNMSSNLAIGSFVEQIKNQPNGGIIHTKYLETKRDFLDIDDICEAYMEILFKGMPGQVYNVCSDDAVSMREMLEKMIFISGKQFSVDSQPNSPVNEIAISCGDNAKLRELGWKRHCDLDSSLRKLLI